MQIDNIDYDEIIFWHADILFWAQIQKMILSYSYMV